MCQICGQPDYMRCQCEVTQPFCDQCEQDDRCAQTMDSACVIYHPDNDRPTKLTCLGIENGKSVEYILEEVDKWICKSKQIQLLILDTNTIDLVLVGNTLSAHAIISTDAGNALQARSSGLYSPTFQESYKVKVNATDAPDYLFNQVIGGTDSIISIVAIDDNGILKIQPSIDLCALCQAEDFQDCIPPLVAVDSTTIDFTTSGPKDHILTGVVKVSADPGNGITIRPDGLFSENTVDANNGLTKTGSLIQLGGPLIKNTLIDQPFNLTIQNNIFQLGDQADVNYVQAPGYAAGQGRKFQVLSKQNPAGSTFVPNVFNTITTVRPGTTLNTTHQVYSSLTAQVAHFTTNFAISSNAQFGAFSGQLALSSDNNAAVTMPAPISSISCGAYFLNGAAIGEPNSTSQGSYQRVAALRCIGPTFLAGSTSATVPSVNTYYGIYIDEIKTSQAGGKITNAFAIFTEGVSDISRFMGPVQNSGGGVQFTSDVRVKENIRPYERGLDAIDKIEVVRYKFNENVDPSQREQIGIVAQAIEKIIPEAVSETDMHDIEDFKMVDHMPIMYTMLNAIKELKQQVADLKQQLDSK